MIGAAEIQTTDGSVANMEWIGDPESGVDLAFVQSDTPPSTRARLVMPLYDEVLHILVARDMAGEIQTIFDLRGQKVIYDAKTRILSIGKVHSPLESVKGAIRLRILLDRTSIEVFANDGRVYMPLCITAEDDNLSLAASCDQGEVKVQSLRVHELKSAWE